MTAQNPPSISSPWLPQGGRGAIPLLILLGVYLWKGLVGRPMQ
eukprot:CAMPEP_0195122408 /NCGR_PEP_ID=MMETSP0448-20130528/126372_1 /TAXON_ID=66468 /ORGANISM="Heterocapsa triquestra, Strain CCMP 448" /LENGTH=42 /DNA_ID= /DNA_START= /DNA_END= /DNA_ORIENTATION=